MLKKNDLQFIAIIKSTKNPKNMEFQYVYLLKCNKTIEEYTFEDNEVSDLLDIDMCTKLTDVIIGNGITTINLYVFSNCSSLTNVTIGNSVTSIETGAFIGCNSLSSLIFKNTEGWFVADDTNATTGDSIDVTNASTNATNLVTTYKDKYWKRTE